MKKLTLPIRHYEKIDSHINPYGRYRIKISVFDLSKEDATKVFNIVTKEGTFLLDDLEGQYKVIVGHIGGGYEYKNLSGYDFSKENQKPHDRTLEFDVDYMPLKTNCNSLETPDFRERKLIIEL